MANEPRLEATPPGIRFCQWAQHKTNKDRTTRNNKQGQDNEQQQTRTKQQQQQQQQQQQLQQGGSGEVAVQLLK